MLMKCRENGQTVCSATFDNACIFWFLYFTWWWTGGDNWVCILLRQFMWCWWCTFFCTWCCDGGGEDSVCVFFPLVMVVVTKFISSRDTRWPASKRYYAGLSPDDATNLYRAPSNSTFQFIDSETKSVYIIKHESTRFSCKLRIKLFVWFCLWCV